MKRCPTCNRTYDDPGLSFCLEDGTTLIDITQVSPFRDQSEISAGVSPLETDNTPSMHWSAIATMAVVGEEKAPREDPRPLSLRQEVLFNWAHLKVAWKRGRMLRQPI